MVVSRASAPAGSAWIVTALSALFLCVIAFAIPAGPIAVASPGALRGCLVGHGRFSDRMAEQIARSGYTLLAIDLSSAQVGDDPQWVEHLSIVERRRYPVWGWIDLRQAGDKVGPLLRGHSFAGFFLYGKGAASAAKA